MSGRSSHRFKSERRLKPTRGVTSGDLGPAHKSTAGRLQMLRAWSLQLQAAQSFHLVPGAGVEPARGVTSGDFKSPASAISPPRPEQEVGLCASCFEHRSRKLSLSVASSRTDHTHLWSCLQIAGFDHQARGTWLGSVRVVTLAATRRRPVQVEGAAPHPFLGSAYLTACQSPLTEMPPRTLPR